MKSLIWKEWREHQLFFFISIGLIIISRIIPKLLPEQIIGYQLHSSAIRYILPIIFSIVLGAISFTNEFTRNTKSFLLSHPVTSARLCCVKYFSGLILLLVLLLFILLLFYNYFTKISDTNETLWLSFYLYTPIIYSAACLSSLMTNNTLLAIICTPFLLLFDIFLVIPLGIILSLFCPSLFIFNLSVIAVLIIALLVFSFLIWNRALVKDTPFQKIFFITTAVILAFSLGIHAIANLAVSQKLKKTIQQAKAEGIKLTLEEITPPPVPDKDNAALVYQQAFELIDRLKSKYKTEWEYMPYEGKIKAEERTEEQKRTISRRMKDSEFVEFYVLIEKAVNLPSCRFDIEYENLSDSPANNYFQSILSKMRSVARLLAARTYILSEEKRYREALQSAQTGLLLGDYLTSEPLILTYLVRIAIDALAIDYYRSLPSAPEGIIDSDDYQKVIEILDRKNRKSTIAIEGEPVIFCNDYNMESMYLNAGRRTSAVKQNYLKVHVYVLRPTLKAESAFYMKSIMKLMDFSKQPYYSIKEPLRAWEKNIAPEAKLPPRNILARTTIPALSSSIVQQANYQATLDTFKLALALKIYREKHGNYPDTLSPLAPEVIPELPLDPYTGDNYFYRREG